MHSPCLDKLMYFLSIQVHLDIQVGEHAIDYANVAQKDKLTELQLRIRQLLDQVHQITKEQSYQRVSYPINLLVTTDFCRKLKFLCPQHNKFIIRPCFNVTSFNTNLSLIVKL